MLDQQALLAQTGGFGAFQVLVCIVGSLAIAFSSMVITGSAFGNLLTCAEVSNNLNDTGDGNVSLGKHGFRTSVSAAYGLCGDQASLGELSSVFLLAGCIPGSLLAGPAADTIGRIPGTVIGLLGSATMNLLPTFAPYFWLHLASRMACGFFISWAVEAIFVYGNEVLMTEHRSKFVKIYCLGSPIGVLVASVLAYFLREYRSMMTINNIFAIPPALLLFILFPESPSWLSSQRNKTVDQVKQALRRIAWINRRSLPDGILDIETVTQETPPLLETDQPGKENAHGRQSGSLLAAMKVLLSNRTYVILLLSTCLYSFSSGFAYYGFTFVISHAVPNIYVTIALMSCVEPPSLLLMNVLSRSRTLFISAMAIVVFSTAIGVVFIFVRVDQFTLGHSIATVCLAVSGKFASNTAYCTIMAVGAEVYPTEVRNTGVSLLMATLRIGCMLSPLLNFIPYMPARFGVVGLAFLVAAFPALRFPDTRVADLADLTAAPKEPMPHGVSNESEVTKV